jgi:hypothetical protein
MNLTWHIFQKDFVRFRLIVLAWVLVMAARYLAVALVSGTFGAPNIPWLNLIQFGGVLFPIIVSIAPLMAFILVAALVYEDPPANGDAFWVTRPISGLRLLSAKLLAAIMLIVLPPMLVALPWWIASGLGVGELGLHLIRTGALFLFIALLGIGCASVANNYPRYFVWMVAGLAVVVITHAFGFIFHVWGSAPESPWYFASVLAGCVVLLSLGIMVQQYRARHFRLRAAIIALLTLGASIVFFVTAPAKVVELFTPKERPMAGEESIRVAVRGVVHSFHHGGLSVPLEVEGIPKNVVPWIRMNATWRSADGKVWPTKAGSGNLWAEIRRTSREILGLPRDTFTPEISYVNFPVPVPVAHRVAMEADTIEGNADLMLVELKQIAELAVTPQVVRGRGLTLSDVNVGHGNVSLTLTRRTAAGTKRFFGLDYVVLFNRRTGEIIESTYDQRLAGGPAPAMNQVMAHSVGLRFKIPNRAWLEESKLVVMDFGATRTIKRDVAPTQRTVGEAPSLIPPRISLPAKILHEYAGVYQARPGVVLTVEDVPDLNPKVTARIYLHEPGFFKQMLFPASESRFYCTGGNWLFTEGSGFEIEFERNAAGSVTHFIVRQAGREYIVPRVR